MSSLQGSYGIHFSFPSRGYGEAASQLCARRYGKQDPFSIPTAAAKCSSFQSCPNTPLLLPGPNRKGAQASQQDEGSKGRKEHTKRSK